MQVFITVDVEVWPVNAPGWPHTPLEPGEGCRREIAAYLIGKTVRGEFGVPYQAAMFARHGLKATFFVDPMFSFALGLEPLTLIVRAIESSGHAVGLHLHPEWLTDLRVSGLPGFRGPMIASYRYDEQLALMQAGLDRLREAGCRPIPAFRAGSWGADLNTLSAARVTGLHVDCSLNARVPQSFPSLESRSLLQDPVLLEGIVELPLSRLDDRFVPGGRAMSLIGNSAAEIEYMLRGCLRAGRRAASLVLHSNEFVKTERMSRGDLIAPRRMVVRRFERICRTLAEQRELLRTDFVTVATPVDPGLRESRFIPRSHRHRTLARRAEQVLSRWY